MNLTHLPERPINTINTESVQRAGVFREKKLVESQFKQSMKLSALNRKNILQQQAASILSTSEDIAKIRKSYKMQMSMLGSANVTNKQLLAVAALDSATERNNQEF